MLGPLRRGKNAGRRFATTLMLTFAVASPRSAAADAGYPDEARAADAYQRGSMAYGRGDYARAAREFAEADAIAPDPVTLRVALGAATLADDPVLGTELLERAERAPPDKTLAAAVLTARARFAHRVGRIVTRCPHASRCFSTVDAVATEPGKSRVVSVGLHTVAVQGDGPLEQRIVQVETDQVVEVAVAPPAPHPPPPPPPPVPERSGLSPIWFFAATGVTVVLGGVALGSAADTASKHSAFDDAGCDRGPGPTCPALHDSGTGAQARTNALFVATGVVAVGTAAVGVFLVHWGGTRSGSVGLTLHGNQASLRATF